MIRIVRTFTKNGRNVVIISKKYDHMNLTVFVAISVVY